MHKHKVASTQHDDKLWMRLPKEMVRDLNRQAYELILANTKAKLSDDTIRARLLKQFPKAAARINHPQWVKNRRYNLNTGRVAGMKPKSPISEYDLQGNMVLQDFDPHDEENLPQVAGVYVLYDVAERPLYVGQGNNIKDRICAHSEKFWFKKPIVETGAYIEIGDAELRRQVETLLIKFLKSNAVLNDKGVDRS